ncbi:HlyD family efflux transporter periplasmic adaptor subunit [Plantibacter sp. VKM Ac-2885]|uniref:efflux RND transporter periplasmic adaptor subunit n=1 Tax=Plantibacter sp. VKM Ac-2885 TaxID=2783828 RepID=UPI00188B2D98|nr:HlyD family efflux transporter periplasmic adaptor subunit [Plantibacter sp. VKM Ac-2885]MBF4514078.1 HlyD family efflux transporter periplasmic adaptor subunit [Plantibacter sp. VKM Ac-2885]
MDIHASFDAEEALDSLDPVSTDTVETEAPLSRARRPRLGRKGWIGIGSVAAAVLLIACLIVLFANPFAQAPAVKTSSATVETGTVTTTVSAKGAISAAATSNVSFANGGTITGISVAVGQTVAAGQDLATIDPADADRALAKAQSALSAAETALSNLRSAYASARDALADARATLAATPTDSAEYATAAASVRDQQSSLPSKDNDVVSAVKTRDDAARDVDAAQAERDKTVLKAPIAGIVTAINGTVGSVTAGGGTSNASATASGSASGSSDGSSGSGGPTSSTSSGLITISDVSTLFVSASVPEADVHNVAVTQPATVTMAGDTSVVIAGSVVSIAPTPQTNSSGVVSYATMIQLTTPPPTVKLGETGLVSIVTATATDVPTLPSYAVTLTAPGEGTVMLTTKKNGAKAKQVDVKTGLTGDGVIEITDGLLPGDVVQVVAQPDAGPGCDVGCGSDGSDGSENGEGF